MMVSPVFPPGRRGTEAERLPQGSLRMKVEGRIALGCGCSIADGGGISQVLCRLLRRSDRFRNDDRLWGDQLYETLQKGMHGERFGIPVGIHGSFRFEPVGYGVGSFAENAGIKLLSDNVPKFAENGRDRNGCRKHVFCLRSPSR